MAGHFFLRRIEPHELNQLYEVLAPRGVEVSLYLDESHDNPDPSAFRRARHMSEDEALADRDVLPYHAELMLKKRSGTIEPAAKYLRQARWVGRVRWQSSFKLKSVLSASEEKLFRHGGMAQRQKKGEIMARVLNNRRIVIEVYDFPRDYVKGKPDERFYIRASQYR